MLIAREKRKSNIAEYIIYMWQLEDLLRGLNLDINQVEKYVVSQFDTDDEQKKEIYEWYDNLIQMMKNENVAQSGHLQVVKNMVNELTELHFFLLHKANDMKYKQLFMNSGNNLIDYRNKTNLPNDISDIELALHALYGHLMLRLQKKEITSHTTMAMESFSKLIAYLAAKYQQVEEEENKVL